MVRVPKQERVPRRRRLGQPRGPQLRWTGGPANDAEPDAESWLPAFAPAAVAATMRSLVGEAGEVITRGGHRNIWIFPHDAGSPIYLALPPAEPDACEIYAGFAFRATVLAQVEADNGDGEAGGDIAGLVRAITRGQVSEFFDFGDSTTGQLVGREFGYVGHHAPTTWTDETLIAQRYVIPAWSQPLA